MKISTILDPFPAEPLIVDTSLLTYLPGYPRNPRAPRQQCLIYNDLGLPKARLDCAIIRDIVSHLLVDSPRTCLYAHMVCLYDYCRDPRLQSWEGHYIHVAWRVVRIVDERVLFDSLKETCAQRRAVRAGVPADWAQIIWRLQQAGKLE